MLFFIVLSGTYLESRNINSFSSWNDGNGQFTLRLYFWFLYMNMAIIQRITTHRHWEKRWSQVIGLFRDMLLACLFRSDVLHWLVGVIRSTQLNHVLHHTFVIGDDDANSGRAHALLITYFANQRYVHTVMVIIDWLACTTLDADMAALPEI